MPELEANAGPADATPAAAVEAASAVTETPAVPFVDGSWPSKPAEAPVEAAPASETPAPAESTLTREMFYDVSKIPADVDPRVREILTDAQKNYTQKTQAIAGLNDYVEKWGSEEKLQGFLDNFKDEESALDYVLRTVEAMGVPRDQFLKQIEAAQGTQESPAEAAPTTEQPKALTAEDIERIIDERTAAKQAEQAALSEIESTLKSLGVTEDPTERATLATFAMKYPADKFSYSERLRKGHEDMTKFLDAKLEARSQARAANAEGVPAPIAGDGPPVEAPPEIHDWKDARPAVKSYLANLSADRASRGKP